MLNGRRQFFSSFGASLVVGRAGLAATSASSGQVRERSSTDGAPTSPAATFKPVETPDVPKLAWTVDNGVKVFNLVAEPVKRAFLPGALVDAWGYNGNAPGPTIEVFQGDHVRIIVDNHLPEATSMHWHGFEIPIAMDGMPGISQPLIPPGGRFVYEFTLRQAGTFFYHSHMAMQEMMGLIGLFIMHPREAYTPPVDKDFGIILQEWAILPNSSVPNTLSMEFNWLTMNGRCGPATTPLVVKLGERVRIRFVNLGMDHHPIHLHGNTFYVTGTEAGRVPPAAWTPANTVLVGVAQARDVEFEANNPGDWMLHCHMPHHMMNHMASMVGPMLEARGMPAGAGMPEGMGMMQQGAPLSQENGPSLGRSIGLGAELERPTTNMPLPSANGMGNMQGMPHLHGAANAGQVPGYPQDMMMTSMDSAVAKPETFGLAPGWSSGVNGMMTLVRVLPPDLYEQVMARVRDRASGSRG
ncbi:MAG TPA: copper oxidase [Terriglobia bacterium]|nr:copper oxidase [Terriglobia bacterium]